MRLADELKQLSNLKEKAEDAGRLKKAADARYKAQEAACLVQMRAEDSGGFREKDTGVLYTPIFDRVKGQVEDRRAYIQYALDNDEAVQDFLDWVDVFYRDDPDTLRARLYEMLRDLSGLHLKEDQRVLNDLAKTAVDDEADCPPGVTFRPDPYIQRRAS